MNPSSSKPLADNWCQSVCDIVTADIEWNIQIFSFESQFSFPSTKIWIPPLQSSFFSSKDIPNCKWRLDLQDVGRNIRFNLQLLWEEVGKPVQEHGNPVLVKLAIVNQYGEKVFPQVSAFPTNTSFPQFVYSLDKIPDMRRVIQMYKSMSFITVFCEVQTCIYKSPKSGFTAKGFGEQPFSDGDQLLLSQLEELFESKMLNDVTLDVDNRHFQAHKSILASRSKVFAAMFAHETKEKLSNHVKVEDIKADVFQEVLRFIYTGRLPLETMDQMATDLLAAAEKYLLDPLKIECENHLLHRMTPDSCLDLISLTDQHHPASHLKKSAVDYFRRYTTEVIATDGWMQAKQDNAAWLCDILQMALSPAK